jgi:hypothetical protein
MDKDEFRGILEEYFLPMLSGATLGTSRASKQSHSLVAYENPCSLLVKPTRSDSYRIRLLRSQPFSSDEKKLVEIFVEELSNIAQHSQNDFFPQLMDSIPRQLIGRLLPPETGRASLQNNIQAIESLASQTYEGRPIVCGFGTTASVGYGSISFDELWKEDFSRVMSNAFDTIYVGGADGKVFGIESLDDSSSGLLCPYRFSRIATWCQHKNRVAAALNRNGEILVFKNQRLQFAKRRGAWRYYGHDSVLRQFGMALRSDVRRAVYQSCLDVSFARTGGCIAVLTSHNIHNVATLVKDFDLLDQRLTTKTKLFAATIKRRFHNLDRRIRQELLAIDGATIVSSDGTVLAVGAIAKVPGGSTGGGRRAAAIQLSKLGLGIKISSDGPITGFRNKKEIFSL